MCLWNTNTERSQGVPGWYSLILCLQTQVTPPRKYWRPDSSVHCSNDLVSVSSPLQPGHQGSAGGGVTAPPTTGGQPAPATPRQPSLCSFCFQPLHPDPGKAGGFLTLLGLPLRQVEAHPQLLPLFPIELASLWLSGHTDSDTTLSPPSNMVIGPFLCFPFHMYLVYGRGAHMPGSSVEAASKTSSSDVISLFHVASKSTERLSGEPNGIEPAEPMGRRRARSSSVPRDVPRLFLSK